MTNLENISVPDDIHLDIDKTYDFIEANLPEKYTRQVFNLLPEELKVDLSYIRQVKRERIKNAPIMAALYRVAQFNYLQKQS